MPSQPQDTPADPVRLVDPRDIDRNPENPRLYFDPGELTSLQDSIERQGILVPLTVYFEDGDYFILDGERRWRSALKLGLSRVPVIVQPKPDPMTNIMMMFAIHHRRNDWAPIATALSLRKLEEMYVDRYERKPKERELAELASLPVGTLRRYKKLLALPDRYIDMLRDEMSKPSRDQITPDHVIEATSAARRLMSADILDGKSHELFIDSIISKFRTKVITSTVAPRKLAKLARATERGEVQISDARQAVGRLVEDPTCSVADVYKETTEQAEFTHKLGQAVTRLNDRFQTHDARRYPIDADLRRGLEELRSAISRLLGS